jgi:hypothetical protein
VPGGRRAARGGARGGGGGAGGRQRGEVRRLRGRAGIRPAHRGPVDPPRDDRRLAAAADVHHPEVERPLAAALGHQHPAVVEPADGTGRLRRGGQQRPSRPPVQPRQVGAAVLAAAAGVDRQLRARLVPPGHDGQHVAAAGPRRGEPLGRGQRVDVDPAGAVAQLRPVVQRLAAGRERQRPEPGLLARDLHLAAAGVAGDPDLGEVLALDRDERQRAPGRVRGDRPVGGAPQRGQLVLVDRAEGGQLEVEAAGGDERQRAAGRPQPGQRDRLDPLPRPKDPGADATDLQPVQHHPVAARAPQERPRPAHLEQAPEPAAVGGGRPGPARGHERHRRGVGRGGVAGAAVGQRADRRRPRGGVRRAAQGRAPLRAGRHEHDEGGQQDAGQERPSHWHAEASSPSSGQLVVRSMIPPRRHVPRTRALRCVVRRRCRWRPAGPGGR